VEHYLKGTFIGIKQQCSECGWRNSWESQQYSEKIPSGNILLSAAIQLTGSSFRKVSRLFEAMNVACISESTYYAHIKGNR